MRFHICPLNKTCRYAGAPARVSLLTKRWVYGLALTPGSRFVQKWDKKAQSYTDWQSKKSYWFTRDPVNH